MVVQRRERALPPNLRADELRLSVIAAGGMEVVALLVEIFTARR